jgi:hypothetical protein
METRPFLHRRLIRYAMALIKRHIVIAPARGPALNLGIRLLPDTWLLFFLFGL